MARLHAKYGWRRPSNHLAEYGPQCFDLEMFESFEGARSRPEADIDANSSLGFDLYGKQ